MLSPLTAGHSCRQPWPCAKASPSSHTLMEHIKRFASLGPFLQTNSIPHSSVSFFYRTFAPKFSPPNKQVKVTWNTKPPSRREAYWYIKEAFVWWSYRGCTGGLAGSTAMYAVNSLVPLWVYLFGRRRMIGRATIVALWRLVCSEGGNRIWDHGEGSGGRARGLSGECVRRERNTERALGQAYGNVRLRSARSFRGARQDLSNW